jgi:hypothetical protein
MPHGGEGFFVSQLENQVTQILEGVNRLHAKMDCLVVHRVPKEWYTTAEIATLVKREPFTVREWCRHHRVHAEKRAAGRGKHKEWMISHDELLRFQNEGLLPLPKN